MGAITQVHVDPSNFEQARAWDGDEGAYWAEHAERFDRAVGGYRTAFFDAAGIAADDRVLDIGCGTGGTTRDAARVASAGTALGVDLSFAMVDYARRQTAREGVHNAKFEQADAQIYPFAPAAFDIAISRTGAMFFGDPHAAFTNFARALRPGGRLVLLTWRPPQSNEWIMELTGALAAGRDLPSLPADGPGPFSLADPDRIHTTLSDAGFVDIQVEALCAPMWWGDTAEDAFEFAIGLLGWMLQGVDQAVRDRAVTGLRETLVAHETKDGVCFGSAASLVRARSIPRERRSG